MAKLLYSALAADGSKVEGFVEADSSALARSRLEGRGLREVVLHQEVMIAQDSAELEGLSDAQQRELARFKLRAMRAPGMATVLAETARRLKWWLAAALIWIVHGAWTSQAAWAIAGVVGLVLPFAVAAWKWRHGSRYIRLIEAFSIGDWPQVHRLAEQLRALSKSRPEIEFDLDVRLACADAREGRLAGGLQRVAASKGRASLPLGMYEARVATVHLSAGDGAEFVRQMEAALSFNPGDPTRMLDAALAQARYGDAQRAEALLAAIDTGLLPPHALGFVHWARGRVQLQRRQPEAAETLGQAVTAFLSLTQTPAVWTSLAFATLDHALALKAAGAADAARRQLAQVWPIVKAHARPAELESLRAEGLAPADES